MVSSDRTLLPPFFDTHQDKQRVSIPVYFPKYKQMPDFLPILLQMDCIMVISPGMRCGIVVFISIPMDGG
jgi:hypothetical protein